VSQNKKETVSLGLCLPWPPSLNSLYKRRSMKSGGGGLMMTDKGKAYKLEVGYMAKGLMTKKGIRTMMSPVSWTMVWHPPDRRKRDGSNLLKILEDSFNKIVYFDDELIHEHHLYKGDVVKGGIIMLKIEGLIDGTRTVGTDESAIKTSGD
jgi:Holliday junction resolvase RusA-like endonuclease